MYNQKKMKIPKTRQKTIIFTGGINEEVSNLELKAGELTHALNYVEKDGAVNGYASVGGYERYDGRTAPSSLSVSYDSTLATWNDVNREAARTAIQPIPGSGNTTGVHIYGGVLYGVRDNAGATKAETYKATAAGWTKISAASQTAGGACKFINGTFRYYNSNNEAMFWVDGVSEIHAYNGTAVSTITDANLPAGVYADFIGIWEGRLFVTYGDWVYVSRVGRPDDFDSTLGAGAFKVGGEITGVIKAPGGTLMIFTKDSIHFVDDQTITTDFAYTLEEYSSQSGAIEGTPQRMLGEVYFADDRGITTLEATDVYGDFSAKALSKKIEKSYQSIKGDIVTSVTNREDNQYVVFYNVADTYAEGFVFTFKSKRLKGVTKIRYNHPIYCSAQGKDTDRNDDIFVGSSDGMVYQIFKGTSFDGDTIDTYFSTAYYHYNSPVIWKHFKSLLFEISGEDAVDFTWKLSFDYKESKFPDTETEAISTANKNPLWGVGVWGVFVWDPIELSRMKELITGYGTTMQIRVETSEKYKEPHSIHNAVVSYTKGSQRH